MKEEIKKELEETIIETIKQVRVSTQGLVEGCELRDNCAAIGLLVDTLLRLETAEISGD